MRLDTAIHALDRLTCGKTMLHAATLLEIGSERERALRLAVGRCIGLLSTLSEIAGFYLITIGLLPGPSVWWLPIGVAVKIGSNLLGAYLQGAGALILSCEIRRFVAELTPLQRETRSALAKSGVTSTEMKAIEGLSAKLYRNELRSVNRTLIISLGAPLGSGIALIINGYPVLGIVVIALGLCSLPLGIAYLKPRLATIKQRLRLGESANLISYVYKTLKRDCTLQFTVDTLANLPLVVFTIYFLFDGVGQLLAGFYVLTQSLVGLTASLSMQSSRTEARSAVKGTIALITAIEHSSFLVTRRQWDRHIERKGSPTTPVANFNDGVILSEVEPVFVWCQKPLSLALDPLSCAIGAGAVHKIERLPQLEKSALVLSISHFLEHMGDIYFVDKGKTINAHQIARDELRASICYHSQGQLPDALRIIDLFKGVYQEKFPDLSEEMKGQFGEELASLALESEDGLLEAEIEAHKGDDSKVFPHEMIPTLKALREGRSHFVQQLLDSAGGALTDDRFGPTRLVASCSPSEKTRLALLLTRAQVHHSNLVRMVILDDPFLYLNDEEAEFQQEVINGFSAMAKPPAILMITPQVM